MTLAGGYDVVPRHLTGPVHSLSNARPKSRVVLFYPCTVVRPDLRCLDSTEDGKPVFQPFIADPHTLRSFEVTRHPGERRLQGLGAPGVGEPEGILGNQKPDWVAGRPRFIEQHTSHPRQSFSASCKPSGYIETGTERDDAFEADTPQARANAHDAAVARRQAHRPAAIRAKGKIDELGGDGTGRSVGGPARDTLRVARVKRRSVMDIFAGQTVGHFIGERLAHHAGPGIQQALHRRRRDIGRRMGLEPGGIAEPGAGSGNIEDILDAERQAGKRTLGPARQRDVISAAERASRILGKNAVGTGIGHYGLCRAAGSRVKVCRPRLKP